jgi:hypothetical protein
LCLFVLELKSLRMRDFEVRRKPKPTGCSAATLRPGCGRRCQLARPAALAALSLDSRDFSVGGSSPSCDRSSSSCHLYKVCRGTPSSFASHSMFSQHLKRSTAIRRNISGYRHPRPFAICRDPPFPTKGNFVTVSVKRSLYDSRSQTTSLLPCL